MLEDRASRGQVKPVVRIKTPKERQEAREKDDQDPCGPRGVGGRKKKRGSFAAPPGPAFGRPRALVGRGYLAAPVAGPAGPPASCGLRLMARSRTAARRIGMSRLSTCFTRKPGTRKRGFSLRR